MPESAQKIWNQIGLDGNMAIDILLTAFTERYTQFLVPGPFFHGSLC